MIENSDMGKLLSNPDLKNIKRFFMFSGPLVMSMGLVFMISTLMMITQYDFIETQITGLLLFIPGFLLFCTGIIIIYRSFKFTLCIYEHGFIDHYFYNGKKREILVISYLVENDVLYGITKGDGRVEIIKRNESGIIQDIYDQIVMDISGYC